MIRFAALLSVLLLAGILLSRADIQNDWVPVSDPQSQQFAQPYGSQAWAPPTPALAGPAPDGALAAMLAIDPRYFGGIVLVTARNGTPVPPKWSVIARNSEDLGTLHKITVADGQVIADVQSMNAFEAFRQDVSINPQQVQIDSGNAFAIAQPIAAANQKIIGRVDYALTIRGIDASPIWTLNCFDINGGYIGQVILLATTGTVLSHPGFKVCPAQ